MKLFRCSYEQVVCNQHTFMAKFQLEVECLQKQLLNGVNSHAILESLTI